jgi:hypothetical protein
MSKKKKTLNKKLLKELLNRETFAYETGNDFGDGKDYTSTQISANKSSDEISRMTIQEPSNALPNDWVSNGYLREGKGIAEAILSKVDSEDNDVIKKDGSENSELIDKANKDVKGLKKTMRKIDFSLIDDKTKEEIINKIKNG